MGASAERLGAEVFVDELKIFNSFLSRQRAVENMGGDNVPFGINTIKLACLDCSMKEAFNACQEGFHLASTQELIAGGYQLALLNGWNKMNPDFWDLDPNRPNVQELRFESPLKKAALCFKDKKAIR